MKGIMEEGQDRGPEAKGGHWLPPHSLRSLYPDSVLHSPKPVRTLSTYSQSSTPRPVALGATLNTIPQSFLAHPACVTLHSPLHSPATCVTLNTLPQASSTLLWPWATATHSPGSLPQLCVNTLPQPCPPPTLSSSSKLLWPCCSSCV